jgi:NADPH2:quinone reductase
VRAAVCPTYGPPDGVRVEDIPPPPLVGGQVRVRVGAAAVNYPDVLVVADTYQVTVPLPFVVGSEAAGVVTEVADDVDGVVVGATVTATAIAGAFAEEMVVPASSITPVPDGVDLAHAAAFGVAHRTAYHVLRSTARVQPGDELVVLGAGGGVGLAAVQLGAHLGATVTAVASSSAKLDAARTCGATHVIDHRTSDLRAALREALPQGSDVVVDPVGGPLSEPALRSLRYGGRFVTVGYASGEIPRIPLNLVLLKGCQVLGFQFLSFAQHAPDEMVRNEAELWALLASGRVVPHIGSTFGLDEVVDALELVGSGQAVGKVIVDVDPTVG